MDKVLAKTVQIHEISCHHCPLGLEFRNLTIVNEVNGRCGAITLNVQCFGMLTVWIFERKASISKTVAFIVPQVVQSIYDHTPQPCTHSIASSHPIGRGCGE